MGSLKNLFYFCILVIYPVNQKMNLFSLIQYGLLIILLVYLAYYLYNVIFNKSYQPFAWRKDVGEITISKKLKKAEKNYSDKTRFFNFWLQVERLKKDNVVGLFAELGVYQGDSANIIHLMDPSREFHLFDTFEGFKQKDLDSESGKAATYTTHNFADTSIEAVIKKLQSDKFVFHKGYFPETATSVLHKKFALVNLDADLYNPTKAGLEFFYPKLSPGGVIIVHDNNQDWPGIMKAVEDFTKSIPVPVVPITDTDSSVMLLKPYE